MLRYPGSSAGGLTCTSCATFSELMINQRLIELFHVSKNKSILYFSLILIYWHMVICRETEQGKFVIYLSGFFGEKETGGSLNVKTKVCRVLIKGKLWLLKKEEKKKKKKWYRWEEGKYSPAAASETPNCFQVTPRTQLFVGLFSKKSTCSVITCTAICKSSPRRT